MTITDRTGNIAQGLAVKAPCKCATTANITLSGLQTIDGIAVTENVRVLVKDQTDATENGIYQASAGSWTRPSDADGNESWIAGTLVYVVSGSNSAGTLFVLTCDDDPVVIDDSELNFTNVNTITSTPWTSTSASSVSIGTGQKTFTTQAGKLYQAGDLILAKKTGDATLYVFGPVVSYSGSSLVIDVRDTGGSGTVSAWDIRVSAPPVISSYQNKLNYVFRRTWWYWNGQ